MRNWSTHFSLFADVLADPADAFTRLAETPGWYPALVLSSLTTAGIVLLTEPFQYEAMMQDLARVIPSDVLNQSSAVPGWSPLLECAAIPFGLAARWAFLSAVLFLALVATGGSRIRFIAVFSVVAYSHLALLVGDLVNTLILYGKGIDAVHSSTDLDCMIGAGRMLADPSTNKSFFAFLNTVNPFEGWHVGLLTIGLATGTGISRRRLALVVTAIVLLLAAGSGATLSLLGSVFTQR